MMTVKQVSRLSGVSIRTLHYYDEIGLLIPAVTTEAGYRLYDDTNLSRLQQILLYRELDFSLKEIAAILDSPRFDRNRALEQQIELLETRRERIERLIAFAGTLKTKDGDHMNFDVFDRRKMDAYAAEAKKKWGDTEAYREYAQKTADYSGDKQREIASGLMDIFREFGAMPDKQPESAAAQEQVGKLQAYITANYYTCTKQILRGLGQMYAAGGEMTENIDSAGGEGTAAFAAKAIEVFCRE